MNAAVSTRTLLPLAALSHPTTTMEEERYVGHYENEEFAYYYPLRPPPGWVPPFELRCDMCPYDYNMNIPVGRGDVPEFAWRLWWPDETDIAAETLFEASYKGQTLPNIRLGRGADPTQYYVMSRMVLYSERETKVYFAHITLGKFTTDEAPKHFYEYGQQCCRLVMQAEEIMAAAVQARPMQVAVIGGFWTGGDFSDKTMIIENLTQLDISEAGKLHDRCEEARALLERALNRRFVRRDRFHLTFDAVAEPCRDPPDFYRTIGLKKLRPLELTKQLSLFLQHPEYEEFIWWGTLTHEPYEPDDHNTAESSNTQQGST